MTVAWLDDSEEKNYLAASDYLSLVAEPELVERTVASLHDSSLVTRKAKDILRASRLTGLPKDNPRVAKDIKNIKNDVPLSPILLVRGKALADVPLHVADGYHRLSACYLIDENTPIPCKLVSWQE